MDIPELQEIASSMSEDTLALNSSTSSEYGYLDLSEKVDLISTTLGAKPPSIPLREERISLGVETVFKAKGVAWNGVRKKCRIIKRKKKAQRRTKLRLSVHHIPFFSNTCCFPLHLGLEETQESRDSHDDANVNNSDIAVHALSYEEYLDYLQRCNAKRNEKIEYPYLELERTQSSFEKEGSHKTRMFTKDLEDKKRSNAVTSDGELELNEIHSPNLIIKETEPTSSPLSKLPITDTLEKDVEEETIPSSKMKERDHKAMDIQIVQSENNERTNAVIDTIMKSSEVLGNSTTVSSCPSINDSTIQKTNPAIFLSTKKNRSTKPSGLSAAKTESSKILSQSRKTSIMDSVDNKGVAAPALSPISKLLKNRKSIESSCKEKAKKAAARAKPRIEEARSLKSPKQIGQKKKEEVPTRTAQTKGAKKTPTVSARNFVKPRAQENRSLKGPKRIERKKKEQVPSNTDKNTNGNKKEKMKKAPVRARKPRSLKIPDQNEMKREQLLLLNSKTSSFVKRRKSLELSKEIFVDHGFADLLDEPQHIIDTIVENSEDSTVVAIPDESDDEDIENIEECSKNCEGLKVEENNSTQIEAIIPVVTPATSFASSPSDEAASRMPGLGLDQNVVDSNIYNTADTMKACEQPQMDVADLSGENESPTAPITVDIVKVDESVDENEETASIVSNTSMPLEGIPEYEIPASFSMQSCSSSLYSQGDVATKTGSREEESTSIVSDATFGLDDLIPKSFSMGSFNSSKSYFSFKSSRSELSTHEVEQCISFTVSELGRIHSMLDVEEMSCNSESTNGRDVLYFAKQSKTEIAALANLIERQIATEKDAASFVLEPPSVCSTNMDGLNLMQSQSYGSMKSAMSISKMSLLESHSMDRLIHEVNDLCTQIEDRIDNIVNDSAVEERRRE